MPNVGSYSTTAFSIQTVTRINRLEHKVQLKTIKYDIYFDKLKVSDNA